MPSRRSQISMTPEEVDAFLRRPGQVMNIATIGADGRPHLVAMWYGFLDAKPAFHTFNKSQKIVNLRRDPRITCLVEAGDTYGELCGVELIGTGTLVEDVDRVVELSRTISPRYPSLGPVTQAEAGAPDERAVVEALRRTLAKRVAVVVEVERVVSWDHAKLVGRY